MNTLKKFFDFLDGARSSVWFRLIPFMIIGVFGVALFFTSRNVSINRKTIEVLQIVVKGQSEVIDLQSEQLRKINYEDSVRNPNYYNTPPTVDELRANREKFGLPIR